MIKIRLCLVAFTLLIGTTWLSSCISQQERAIQGKWVNGNAHYWAEWNFDGGAYSYYYDNGFTNIYETGRYSIETFADDYIDLQLFNRQGGIREMMEESVSMRISFEQAGVINIKGGDYYQVTDSSLLALETAKAPLEK